MNQDKHLGSAVRSISIVALLAVLGAAATLACAGANGDPAPAPQEAGAALDPCVDAGATE